jgi:hypothetical protein
MMWPANGRRAWLAATALMFAGWLFWLAYLAATASRPIVLSRPQLLVSTLVVVAEIHEKDGRPDPRVVISQIPWLRQGKEKRVGEEIKVTNLTDCDNWRGPGHYILFLVPDGLDWRVATIPPSPGYDFGGRPRIYASSPETLAQLNAILKSWR